MVTITIIILEVVNLSERLTKRMNVQLPEELINKVDAFANTLHINRTAAVSVLLFQALQMNEGMETLKELNKKYDDHKISGAE